MREQSRTFLIILALLWGVSIFFFLRPAETETPTEEAVPEVATVDNARAKIVEEAGVKLSFQSDTEGMEVNGGSQVRYTILVENDSTRTINPIVTNDMPVDLVLEAQSVEDIEISSGTIDLDENAFSWQGELAQGDKVSISYTIHPNYFSTAGQTLDHTIRLKADNVSLETTISIINTQGFGQWFIIGIARVLEYVAGILGQVNIPYTFGFAIILFTVVVRGATFPLNKKQIESTKATQEIQPKLKELQKKYADDREKLAQEQMKLYKEHGINPLGGCLPLIVQMPIWLALYRALFHMANDTTFLDAGFLWIPSLAGPVGPITNGFSGGIDWLIPWGDGFLGWGPALAYLVLPIMLVVSQLYMQKMMTPQSDDPQQKMMGQIMMFMPFMFGYFALVVPAGLSVYWITSNLLGIVQQNYMMKAKAELEVSSNSDERQEQRKISVSPKLETSPATATIDTSASTEEQVKVNGKRKSRPKKKRRRRK